MNKKLILGIIVIVLIFVVGCTKDVQIIEQNIDFECWNETEIKYYSIEPNGNLIPYNNIVCPPYVEWIPLGCSDCDPVNCICMDIGRLHNPKNYTVDCWIKSKVKKCKPDGWELN